MNKMTGTDSHGNIIRTGDTIRVQAAGREETYVVTHDNARRIARMLARPYVTFSEVTGHQEFRPRYRVSFAGGEIDPDDIIEVAFDVEGRVLRVQTECGDFAADEVTVWERSERGSETTWRRLG